MREICAVTLLVPSYEEGLAFYVGSLGFALIEDTPLDNGKRWVLVAPEATSPMRLLLAKAANASQAAAIGAQSGGRVFLFLKSDDFWRDHAAFTALGVHFLEEPRQESYGLVAVFSDPFGNKWDLIEPNDQIASSPFSL